MLDNEGLIEGCTLGWDDGCEVGQSDTEGFIDGSRLGCLEGQLLGWMLGLDVGSDEGWDDADGWNDG